MKAFFSFISYFFHPLFMAVWSVLILFITDPIISIYFNGYRGFRVAIILLLLMIVIPIVFIKLLKEFDVITDFKMPTKEERFTAYAIITGIYFLNYQMLFQLGAPRSLRLIIMGIGAILLSLTIMNKFFKISAHMAAVGGVIGYLMSAALQGVGVESMLVLSILLGGVIASARLYEQAHNYGQLISGVLVGSVIMFVIFQVNWLPVL